MAGSGSGQSEEDSPQMEGKEIRQKQAAVAIGQSPSSLSHPNLPHRLGVGEWEFFVCWPVSRLFVTVSDLMLRRINHAKAPPLVCTVHTPVPGQCRCAHVYACKVIMLTDKLLQGIVYKHVGNFTDVLFFKKRLVCIFYKFIFFT